ncbi:MAG: hypothetical protein HY762_00420 [Planctomycetes bacterium]|nr:hypothetical protein [Planctomycetota bacterium]
MNILILSRKKTYYSTKRLVEEAKKLHHQPTILDPLTCPLYVKFRNPQSAIRNYDVVLPRIGTIGLEYSLLLLEQVRMQAEPQRSPAAYSGGIKVVNSPEAIGLVKNKFHCLQVLAKRHLPVPPTAMVREHTNIEKVIKQLDG